MHRLFATTFAFVVATLLVNAQDQPDAPGARAEDTPAGQVIMEFVGQVQNFATAPPTSHQFGYLSYVRGLDDIFTGSPNNEQTARFTFYNTTTTLSVVNNGPIRVITREGQMTVYLRGAGADFATPESFRSGNPVQSSKLRHVVVLNTTSNAFTTTFEHVVTAAPEFSFDGREVRLGRMGDRFRSVISGQNNVAGATPSAWIAGYAVSTSRQDGMPSIWNAR
jgi:hypothetical protein